MEVSRSRPVHSITTRQLIIRRNAQREEYCVRASKQAAIPLRWVGRLSSKTTDDSAGESGKPERVASQ